LAEKRISLPCVNSEVIFGIILPVIGNPVKAGLSLLEKELAAPGILATAGYLALL